jgi:hypothetical protein
LKCFAPEVSAVIKGRLISVCIVEESSTLAFSAASLSLCSANLSLVRSMPSDFLNSATRYSSSVLSKSSPPRKVSPLVALT